jgi:PilZ domain
MTDSNPMPAFLSADFLGLDPEGDSVSARGESRDSLFLTAEVWSAGWPAPVAVRVRNLSAGGLLAESAHQLPVGTVVQIQLANIGLVGARCVWAGENRFGVAFDHAIDPQAVRRKVGSRSDVPATLIGMTLHTTKFKKPLRPV